MSIGELFGLSIFLGGFFIGAGVGMLVQKHVLQRWEDKWQNKVN